MADHKRIRLPLAFRAGALLAQALPSGVVRGLYRLGPISRLIRGALNRFAPSGLTQVTVAGGPLAGARLLLDLRQEKDLWLGTYEPHMLDAIRRHVHPGTVAYDVGAHIGYLTLALAQAVGPDGRVVAFEPLPDNLDRLRSCIALNGLEGVVQVQPAAVGEVEGHSSFLIHPSPGMGKLNGSFGRQGDYRGSHRVDVIALDAFVFRRGGSRPDLVKIDVEGGEVVVLQGMQRILREAKPILLLELHGSKAREGAMRILRQAGYRIRHLGNDDRATDSARQWAWKAYVLALPAEAEA